jgi:hypothetical protein
MHPQMPGRGAGLIAVVSFAMAVATAGCGARVDDEAIGGGGTLGAGPGATATGASAARGGSRMAGASCAEGLATTAPVTPTVWLVVDGSGSMDEAFEATTRWEALREALIDPGGVVATLEAAVRFGLVLYDGPEDGLLSTATCFMPENIDPGCLCFSGFEPACCQASCGATPMPAQAPAQCANVSVIEPALSNHAAIDAAYPGQPLGGSTPTDRALERVVSALSLAGPMPPDSQTGPVIVVLATDGAPNDACGGTINATGVEVAQRVVDAVSDGVSMGMRLFVISLAGDDAELRSHLQQVASVGSPGQSPFEPSTKGDLVAALRSIISGATCQVTLNGTVAAGQECTGEVTLNGEPLSCNSPDGFRLTDDHTLGLTGSACDRFLAAQSSLHAQFPCGVFIPL